MRVTYNPRSSVMETMNSMDAFFLFSIYSLIHSTCLNKHLTIFLSFALRIQIRKALNEYQRINRYKSETINLSNTIFFFSWKLVEEFQEINSTLPFFLFHSIFNRSFHLIAKLTETRTQHLRSFDDTFDHFSLLH